MNKKTIITILLALAAMAGQAKKTIVWENPSVAYSVIHSVFSNPEGGNDEGKDCHVCQDGSSFTRFSLPNQQRQLSANKWEAV